MRPNITGQSGASLWNGTLRTGVFAGSNQLGIAIWAVGGSGSHWRVDFNAHNSNNVYSDYGSVHPLSLTFHYVIKC